MSSWLSVGHLYLHHVVIYNVHVDTSDATDEKCIPFHPGFSELHLVQCHSSGKNIASDDG
jgi:hypothetical protein